MKTRYFFLLVSVVILCSCSSKNGSENTPSQESAMVESSEDETDDEINRITDSLMSLAAQADERHRLEEEEYINQRKCNLQGVWTASILDNGRKIPLQLKIEGDRLTEYRNGKITFQGPYDIIRNPNSSFSLVYNNSESSFPLDTYQDRINLDDHYCFVKSDISDFKPAVASFFTLETMDKVKRFAQGEPKFVTKRNGKIHAFSLYIGKNQRTGEEGIVVEYDGAQISDWRNIKILDGGLKVRGSIIADAYTAIPFVLDFSDGNICAYLENVPASNRPTDVEGAVRNKVLGVTSKDYKDWYMVYYPTKQVDGKIVFSWENSDTDLPAVKYFYQR